jgi:FERM domain-containing protein 4
MAIAQRLPKYGIHYYAVKDKRDVPWKLGISPAGIAEYDFHDTLRPRKASGC